MSNVIHLPVTHNGNQNIVGIVLGESERANMSNVLSLGLPLTPTSPALVRTPELLLIMAMLKAMTPEQRFKVANTTDQACRHCKGDESTIAADYIINQLIDTAH